MYNGDDLSSMLYYYQDRESVEEMKQSLENVNCELQLANEEIRKNRDSIKQLQHLLQMAYKERDEARDQLQTLLVDNILTSYSASPPPPPPPPPTNTITIPKTNTKTKTKTKPCNLSPESPLFNNINQVKSNSSSAADSSSATNTFNNNVPHFSHNSSSAGGDSLYDVVSPLDLCSNDDSVNNIAFVNPPPPFISDLKIEASHADGSTRSTTVNTVDPDDLIIHKIAGMKPLPEKGKLMQAVIESGPLLQTLMVAGPLPRWRNPPPTVPVAPLVTSTCSGFDPATNGNRMLKKRSFSARSAAETTPVHNYPISTAAGPTPTYPTATSSSAVAAANSVWNFGSSGICISGLASSSTGGCFGTRLPVPKSYRIR